MITKNQAKKHINRYKPIQLELQKLIFILKKALEKDELIYVFNSPDGALQYLEQADQVIEDNINHICCDEEE